MWSKPAAEHEDTEALSSRPQSTLMPTADTAADATAHPSAAKKTHLTAKTTPEERLGPDPNDPEEWADFQAFLAECGTAPQSGKRKRGAAAHNESEVESEPLSAASESGPHTPDGADASSDSKEHIAHSGIHGSDLKAAAAAFIAEQQQAAAAASKDDATAATADTDNAATATAAAAAAKSDAPQDATVTPKSSSTSGDNSAPAVSSSGGGLHVEAELPPRRRKHEFWRSLQFRVMMVFAFASLITTASMGVMSYLKSYKSTQEFIDEELSQISLVAINYQMALPRRWEPPRHNHERILRLRQENGRIIVEYGAMNPQNETNAAGQTPDSAMGMGPGHGRGQGQGMGRGMGRGMSHGQNAANANGNRPEDLVPSIVDLHKFNYDIIIAPLFGRPGDPLYIPPGVADGFYTVLVADQRVRAFVSTNMSGQRFVVARPLASMENINRQALISSIWQFIGINLLFIPLLMISVRLMFTTLNKIARSLYKRTEDDLSPVISDHHKGFVPSELDGFISSLNRLFSKVNDGIQSKRRFIADAAHEMRTPLTALSLQAESLEQEELSPKARAKVQRLKEGISRERELMTALLTLAREQNRIDLHLETIDILEVFTKLIDEQGLLAERKDIDLGVEGEAHYSVVTDRMRLMRVMSNLVSNAIKYTDEGGRIDLMAKPLDDGRLQLIVQDNGPGIPEENLQHILEPFYRVHGDRSSVQGTGLGLAIVKASCDSIKADLDFKNAQPHGLVATVTLRSLQA